MKGYFSQLAKHSGIRFTSQGERTSRDGGGAAKASEIAPLHVEETKLVAPDLPQPEAPKSVDKAFSKIDSDAPHKKSALNQPSSTQMQSTVQLLESEKPQPHKIDSRSQHFEMSTENSSEIQTAETELYPSKNASPADARIVEQAVFEESEKTATEISKPPSSLSSALSEKGENRPAQKEYFKKTNELLETGTAGKPEIQQILLQEVQEWAADAPVSDETENKTTEIEKQKVRLVESQPSEREPFALREGVSGDEETESPELAEQNFELSIGTISIVTEAAEKPVETANLRAEKKIDNTRRETGRQFSRLSRHYL